MVSEPPGTADSPAETTVPVSVIIPTYNRSVLVRQSIDSILAQTRLPKEIIVVNDGSTDDTVAVLQNYGERIRLLDKENGGKSTALNLGLEMASQPSIWIFDDDDIACPQALERLHDALAAAPEAGIAYGTFDRFFGDWPSPLTEPWSCYVSADRRALYIKLMQDFFVWQGAMLVRAECYREVGPFDVRYARSQDYEMALRLMRRFSSVGIPHVVFHQRHHAGERGPSHARFGVAQTEARWAHFNRMMFSEVYRSHHLEEFCIRPGSETLDARSEITALLQRASVMGRKGLWEQATADMRQAAEKVAADPAFELNAQEMTALRTVFEQGSRSQFNAWPEALRFRAAIRGFPARIAGSIQGNLLLPVTNRMRLMASRPDKKREARQLAFIASVLLGPGAFRSYFQARRKEHRLYNVQPLTVRR